MSIERKRLILTLIPPAAGPCWRCGPRYAMDFLLMGLITGDGCPSYPNFL